MVSKPWTLIGYIHILTLKEAILILDSVTYHLQNAKNKIELSDHLAQIPQCKAEKEDVIWVRPHTWLTEMRTKCKYSDSHLF